MTTQGIEAPLLEIHGINASRELISNVTDVVVDEIKAWQTPPLSSLTTRIHQLARFRGSPAGASFRPGDGIRVFALHERVPASMLSLPNSG